MNFSFNTSFPYNPKSAKLGTNFSGLEQSQNIGSSHPNMSFYVNTGLNTTQELAHKPLPTPSEDKHDEFPTESILYSKQGVPENPFISMETPQRNKTMLEKSFMSPSRYDPHNDMGTSDKGFGELDVGDKKWVRVFGFPLDQSSYILKQFGQYGTIIEYKMGEGNWMDICYKSQLQAQRALGKNAKVYQKNMMIGVCEHVPLITKKRYIEDLSGGTPSPSKKKKSVELNADEEEDADEDEPRRGGVIQAIFDYIFKF